MTEAAITDDTPTARVLHTKPYDVTSALSLQLSANNLRAVADSARKKGDLTLAGCREIEADEMEGAAAAFLVPDKPLGPPGIGGELVPTAEDMENAPAVFDTLKTSPDMLNATASRERLNLAAAAGALVLGTDIAETIGARNSLERMLAHQLGAVHLMAMKFSEQATQHLALYRLQSDGGPVPRARLQPRWPQQDQTRKYQALLVEASRAANTATRLFSAFQDGLLDVRSHPTRRQADREGCSRPPACGRCTGRPSRCGWWQCEGGTPQARRISPQYARGGGAETSKERPGGCLEMSGKPHATRHAWAWAG